MPLLSTEDRERAERALRATEDDLANQSRIRLGAREFVWRGGDWELVDSVEKEARKLRTSLQTGRCLHPD